MKQFCKKISLFLVIGAGTSIAMQEKPLETLLPSKTWGVLSRDIQLVIANQLIKDAVDYINQLMIPHTIQAHASAISSVGFNHDGSRIVSGAWDGMIKLWDIDNDQPIRTFSHGSPVNSVEFNHDGSRIVSGARNGMIKIWDIDNDHPIRTFHHGGDSVNSVGFNHYGSRIVSGAWDGMIKIWDANNDQLIRTFPHGDRVYYVGFNHDGSRIVSGAWDGMIKIWNADNGQLINTFQHGNYVYAVAFSPDGSMVVSGAENGKIKIWDLHGERKEKVFKWFISSGDFHVEHAVIINYAYEAKLRGKKLALKGDGLLWFNTMPDYVCSLLIDYLDIIPPEFKYKSD